MLKLKFICVLIALFFWSNGAFAQKTERPVFKNVGTSNPPAGSVAPNFSLVASDGSVVQLSAYKGKVVILDVWATWCVPCRAGLPVLDSITRSLKKSGVVMLAVCCADSKKNFDKYINENKEKFSCEFLFDTESTTDTDGFRKTYGINGFPTTMVIDRDGRIKGYGFTHDEIEILLKEAIDNDK